MCLFLLRSDFGLHVNVGLELRTADRAAARRLSQSLPGTDFVHQCIFLWSVSAVPNWYTCILDRLVVVPSIRNLKHVCCIYACIRVFVFVIYILRHTDQGSGEYHVHLSTSLHDKFMQHAPKCTCAVSYFGWMCMQASRSS